MADDIDDLLNEVEDKYLTTKPSSSTSKTKVFSGPSSNKTITKDKKTVDPDIDDMIDDIFDDNEVLSNKKGGFSNNSTDAVRRNINTSQTFGSGTGKKCFPIFVGGPDFNQGLATAINRRACDSLRCTDCDFKVSTFDHCQWHPSTDYLFLRNNMPDFEKVKAKLYRKQGYRAYACQCKWRTIKDLLDLQQETDLKWVCGKH